MSLTGSFFLNHIEGLIFYAFTCGESRMITGEGGIQENNQTNRSASQIPQINMALCDILMCSDVLTDTVHLGVIWRNALSPRGEVLQDSVGRKC